MMKKAIWLEKMAAKQLPQKMTLNLYTCSMLPRAFIALPPGSTWRLRRNVIPKHGMLCPYVSLVFILHMQTQLNLRALTCRKLRNKGDMFIPSALKRLTCKTWYNYILFVL